jgi:hypothetical protein
MNGYQIYFGPILLISRVSANLWLCTQQVSTELLNSHPDLAEGLALRGLAHIAQGHHQLAEQRCVQGLQLKICPLLKLALLL